MKTSFLLILFLSIMGCSMPTTTVRSTDSRPGIAIRGASEDAVLYVDSLNMGKARKYNGEPATLIIEQGTHTIRVVENGITVFEQKIFVGSELKTITVK